MTSVASCAALTVLLAAGVIFVPWARAEAGMLYKNEVSTTWDFGEGLTTPEGVYFLTTYRLWQPPGALLRFPDGGRSRSRFGQTLLYRLSVKDGRLAKSAVIEETARPGNNVKSSSLRWDGGKLRAAFVAGNEISSPMAAWRMFSMDLGSGALSRVEGEADKKAFFDRHFPPDAPKSGRVSISGLKKLLEPVPFEAWALPSPLEYAVKSPREYDDDLVELRGDQAYRDAIIRGLSARASPAQVQELIVRMEKRKDALRGSARMEFELYGQKTLDRLRALATR